MENKILLTLFAVSMFLMGYMLGNSLADSKAERLRIEYVKLGAQKTKLERQLSELYQEQAERTKKTAERNGVGG
jgi:hypothetical protein